MFLKSRNNNNVPWSRKLLKAKSIVLRDSRGTKKASLPASRLSPAISAPLYANSAASRSGAVRTDPINSLRHEWSHLSLSVYVSGPPGPRFDDTDIYTTYIRTHGRYYLAYLDPRTHARTHARGRPYCDNERINALEGSLTAHEVPSQEGGGGVFSIRKVSSGPRLLPTAVWNPLRVRTVLRYSEMELLLETRDTRFLNFFEDSKEGEVEGGRILLWWINLKKR